MSVIFVNENEGGYNSKIYYMPYHTVISKVKNRRIWEWFFISPPVNLISSILMTPWAQVEIQHSVFGSFLQAALMTEEIIFRF